MGILRREVFVRDMLHSSEPCVLKAELKTCHRFGAYVSAFFGDCRGLWQSDRDRNGVIPARPQSRVARDLGASYSRLPAFHLMRPPSLPAWEGHLAPGGNYSSDDRHRLDNRRLSGQFPMILSILFRINGMKARRMTGRQQLRIGTDDGQPQGLEFQSQCQMQDLR
jgi:hypothetical protein